MEWSVKAQRILHKLGSIPQDHSYVFPQPIALTSEDTYLFPVPHASPRSYVMRKLNPYLQYIYYIVAYISI